MAGFRDNVYHLSDGGRGGTAYIEKNRNKTTAQTQTTAKKTVGGGGTTKAAAAQPQVDYDALYNQYMNQFGAALAGQGSAMMAQYDDAYERSLARINDAYNSSMGNVAAGYNSALGAYGENLKSTKGVLNDSYKASHGEVTTDAERSLREAYINNMMRKRDLNQTMSAMGLNGGASETTMASLSNQYGNARTQIEDQRAKSLADLLRLRDSNLAAAQQEYNTRLADLQNQRLNMENQLIANRLSSINQADQASASARAQMAMFNAQQMNAYQMNLQNALSNMATSLASGGNADAALRTLNSAMAASPFLTGLQSLGDSALTGFANIGNTGWNTGNYNTNTQAYNKALSSLVDAQQQYAFDATQAANAYNAANVQQAQAAQGTNYAKYLQQLQQELAGGATPNSVKENLYRQVQAGNVARDDLASMLRQLGMI